MANPSRDGDAKLPVKVSSRPIDSGVAGTSAHVSMAPPPISPVSSSRLSRPLGFALERGTGDMKSTSPQGGILAACLVTGLGFAGLAISNTAEAGRHRLQNSSISISGSPATTDAAGSAYSFSPTVISRLTPLSFSISNKPSWATFSITTGMLSGTPAPTQAGSYANIGITVSNGKNTATLAPFGITVTAPATNAPPLISGTPPANVLAGGSYAFRPTASDSNGDPLSFAISGKPAWAVFDSSNGLLSGTPDASYVGSYAHIVISVSDGKATTSLPAFSITVDGVALGSTNLAWTPPVQNTDGSSLANLAGYTIYFGSSSTSLTNKVVVANPGITAYTLGNLMSGTYYFGITAYSTTGAESAMTNIGTRTIL
jgi:hypothetical protein